MGRWVTVKSPRGKYTIKGKTYRNGDVFEVDDKHEAAINAGVLQSVPAPKKNEGTAPQQSQTESHQASEGEVSKTDHGSEVPSSKESPKKGNKGKTEKS